MNVASPMRRMARAFRFTAWTLGAIVILLALGTLAPRPIWPREEPAGEPSHRILVLNNAIHTDIALPIDAALLSQFGFLQRAGLPIDAPGARYVIVGWGGRDFYLNTPTWSQLEAMPLLRGLTLDRSVMHVDVYGGIDEQDPAVTVFDLGQGDYDALTAFVAGSFALTDSAPVSIPGAGYGEADGFFEGAGRFTAILGCNTWTAAALRAAGLRTGWWNPLPPLLFLSLRLYN